MTIYFLNALLVLFWGLILERKKPTYCYRVVFCQLYLLCILRNIHNINEHDTSMYLMYFRNLSTKIPFAKYFDYYGLDRGYVLFNKIIGLFTSSEQIYISIYYFVVLILVVGFFKKYGQSFCISIFLFIMEGFYLQSWIIMRQYLAIAVVLFSIRYVVNKKWLKFMLCVAVACTFHWTAVIALLYIVCEKISIEGKKIIGGFGIAFVLLVLSPYLITIINKFARVHFRASYTGGIYFLIFEIASLVLFTCYGKRTFLKNDINKIFYNMLYMGCLIQIMSLQYELLFRLAAYFTIPSIVLWSEFIKYVFNGRNRLLAYICLICFFMAWYYVQLSKNTNGLVPYMYGGWN